MVIMVVFNGTTRERVVVSIFTPEPSIRAILP